jgi:hypothetical protein
MLRRVALVRTDVSEELSASFIRVTRIGELRTTLGVTSNRRTLRRNIVVAYNITLHILYIYIYIYIYIRRIPRTSPRFVTTTAAIAHSLSLLDNWLVRIGKEYQCRMWNHYLRFQKSCNSVSRFDCAVKCSVLPFQCNDYIPYMRLTFSRRDSENLHHFPINKQRTEG